MPALDLELLRPIRCSIACSLLLAAAQAQVAFAQPQRPRDASRIWTLDDGAVTIPGTLRGTEEAAFRVDLPDGLYRITVRAGGFEPLLTVAGPEGEAFAATKGVPEHLPILDFESGSAGQTMLAAGCDDGCPDAFLYARAAERAVHTIGVSASVPAAGATFEVEVARQYEIVNQTGRAADQAPVLQAGMNYSRILAFDASRALPLTARVRVMVLPGQRVGIHVVSEEFLAGVAVLDAAGRPVASSAYFNAELDPCDETQVEEFQVESTQNLERSHAYAVVQSATLQTFEVAVTSLRAGQSGSFRLSVLDRSSRFLSSGQRRYGVIEPGASSSLRTFLAHLEKGSAPYLHVESDGPVVVRLSAPSGRVVATATAALPEGDSEPETERDVLRLLPRRFSHSADLLLEPGEVDEEGVFTIEVESGTPAGPQVFVVDLDGAWGQCGGGAASPPMADFPRASDFAYAGRRFALDAARASEIAHWLFRVVQGDLSWPVLFEAFDDPARVPTVETVSTFAPYVPRRRLRVAEILVDYRLAMRLRIARGQKSYRVTVWTRVESRGFKEMNWRLNSEETAVTLGLLFEKLARALGGQPAH